MTFVVLGVLAIVWVVVLGTYAKERMADRRTDSVSDFRSQLSTLQRTQPGGRHAALGTGLRSTGRSTSSIACEVARRRRKNLLVGLLSAALVTVLFALVAPGVLTIGLATISVAAFTGYVMLLVERQRVIVEQHAKVRPIAAARRRPAPAQAPVRHSALTVSSRR